MFAKTITSTISEKNGKCRVVKYVLHCITLTHVYEALY